MATEDYVPVVGDDWYQRRRKDAEGAFFLKVADQGPRKGAGGSTRQGIYCLTADGELLAYKNAGQAPDVMREVLEQGLRKWSRLPESRRAPGAVKVENPGRVDRQFDRTPPKNGLIVNVHARLLDRDEKGELCDAECEEGNGDDASRDHLWLTEAEWKSLIPARPKQGASQPVPPAIAQRIARFHLIDNPRGEPPMWNHDEIRKSDLRLTVIEATRERTRLQLDGTVLLSTGADAETAERGYDAQLLGFIDYDAKARRIDRFDVVAIGEHWGQGAFTRGARPGRTPLGIAFELAGSAPRDRIPPQAARMVDEYFGSGRR